MMTYDQAKAFECVRTGIGATYGEIKRLLGWERDRLLKALAHMGSVGWIEINMPEKEILFQATAEGESAYQKWRELPF